MKNSFNEPIFQSDQPESQTHVWIALSIGNTHWRWGYFEGCTLTQTWTAKPQLWNTLSGDDWEHWCQRSPALAFHRAKTDTIDSPYPPLYLSSVVESQQQLWLTYPNVVPLTLSHIPIAGLYQGLGMDRALAVWGAGQRYGWPVLVIDAGTALTFSGADATGFQGGAIAPGLGLQLAMLHKNTAALPNVHQDSGLPSRWAINTEEAILSGVLFSLIATLGSFAQDWCQAYSQSYVIFTGGDGAILLDLLRKSEADSPTGPKREHYIYDAHLIFKGIVQCKKYLETKADM